MAKKKKKKGTSLMKRIKKVFKKNGREIAIGIATGIITNYFTEATKSLVQTNRTKIRP